MTFKETRDRLYAGKVKVLLVEDIDRIIDSMRKPTPEEKKILEAWKRKWTEMPMSIVWPTYAQVIAGTKMAMSSPITQGRVTQSHYYAWHSNRQRNLGGYCVYSTPNGGTIEVTEVNRDKDYKHSFDDAVYMGEVVTCLESHKDMDWFEPSYVRTPHVPRITDEMSRPGRATEVIELGPCPLKYYGAGACSCGKCKTTSSAKKTNSNPFGY